jgi:hypothetical protein
MNKASQPRPGPLKVNLSGPIQAQPRALFHFLGDVTQDRQAPHHFAVSYPTEQRGPVQLRLIVDGAAVPVTIELQQDGQWSWSLKTNVPARENSDGS